MKRSAIVNVLLLVLVLGAVGTARAASLESMEHKYIMVGKVLEVQGKSVYLCTGTEQGANVGQEYVVSKYVSAPNPLGKASTPYFKRVETGKIKIDKVDGHMATGTIASGEVKKNYTVELNR